MRTFSRLIALSLFTFSLLLTGCDSSGEDDDSSPSSVEGVWQSDVIESPGDDFVRRLDLEQNGSDVSGTVEIEFVEGVSAGTSTDIEEGTYNPPDLDLSFGGDTLLCVVQSEAEMSCEATFSGENSEISFERE